MERQSPLFQHLWQPCQPDVSERCPLCLILLHGAQPPETDEDHGGRCLPRR